MVGFLGKYENHAIKIAPVNLFLSPNISIYSYVFTLILCVGVPLWSKAILHAQSIYREVYEKTD